jgi:leucyl aminopeptidase
MNFEITSLTLAGACQDKSDALIVLVPEGFAAGKDAISLLITQALEAKDFEHKAGTILAAYRLPKIQAPKIWLVGCAQGTPAQVRSAMAAVMPAVKSAQSKKLLLVFASLPQVHAVQAAVLTAAETSYVYTTTQSKPSGRKLTHLKIGVPTLSTETQQVFDHSTAMAVGIELAKEWANRPANHATPTLLGEAAKALAKGPKMTCEVLGPKEVGKLGMGSFLSVAKGSREPLRFIVLNYHGTAQTQAPVVLVGKGITFDTGGISIKPAAELDEMKFDMSGAASVLGVFKTLSVLKPAINVVGLIPACENMPDGLAVKPGDVVTSMSGQTIEILNTDAEGRLVLCDALTYAERFKPKAVIDIATLTGACVVALGAVRSGLFATHDGLALALQQAGDQAMDPCWRMPLDDDYADALKSNFADVANIGGRTAGAVTAAKFLQRFAKAFPWAHLDIAGTAWKGGAAKGATGRPVALLMHYLLSQADAKPRNSGKANSVRKAQTSAA